MHFSSYLWILIVQFWDLKATVRISISITCRRNADRRVHAGESGFHLHATGVSKVQKKKPAFFAKIQAGEMLHGNLIQMMFPVCSSVALPRVLHIVLQEDVWRRRPRNTVAIVSHFSFSVLIKGRRSNPFPLTCSHKRLIHSHKSTWRFFFKVCPYVFFFLHFFF